MPESAFADTPEPPYYAVIFSSQRTAGDHGYQATAVRMAELARGQPGFLGMESVRGADGFGMTVAYFTDEASIRGWREHVEHRVAQRRGRDTWYRRYQVRVARVERAYGGGAD